MIELPTGLNALRGIIHTALDTYPTPDALIIPGSGLRANPEAPLGAIVSWDTQLRLEAGSHYFAALAKRGNRPQIILCGGKVYQDFDPIARFAKDYILQGNPNLPVTNIETTTNTLEDIRHARKRMRKMGLTNGLVISNGHHLTAKVLAIQNGLDFMSAEHLLFQMDPSSREFITNLEASPLVKQLKRQQLIRAAILLLPGGAAPYDAAAHHTLNLRAKLTA